MYAVHAYNVTAEKCIAQNEGMKERLSYLLSAVCSFTFESLLKGFASGITCARTNVSKRIVLFSLIHDL